jgi:hypothetical protein
MHRPQSASPGDRALTLAEVTEWLNARGVDVSIFTIRRDVLAGRLPSFRIGARHWVFESDLRDHVRRREPVGAA